MNVKLANIGKKYEGNLTYTLEGVNLDIKSGEFIVLLGPSGCGKTTLLRMIAGLIPITKGDLMFGGRRVNNILPNERDIAMVFQSYALYPTMNVYNNIAFALKIQRISKSKIHSKVLDVAKVLDISHILYKKPSEISGGQRQRVALGRAIIRKPKIFLMDEPLSNLDAKLRNIMRIEIKRVHKLMGGTSIYVTHDQYEAMSLADRIVVINNNEIQQVGTSDDLYYKPNNLFVAKFMGSLEINTFRGNLQKGLFTSSDGKIRFTTNSNATISDVILGVRAENITILDSKRETQNYNAKIKIMNLNKLGNHIEIVGFIDSKTSISISGDRLHYANVKEDSLYNIKFEKYLLFNTINGGRINE